MYLCTYVRPPTYVLSVEGDRTDLSVEGDFFYPERRVISCFLAAIARMLRFNIFSVVEYLYKNIHRVEAICFIVGRQRSAVMKNKNFVRRLEKLMTR